MLKKTILVFTFFIPFTIFSQEVADSISYGDKEIEWRTYETEGQVLAFAVTHSHIWYSTGQIVATYERRTNKKRAYPKLGNYASAGIKTIIKDKNNNVWFGSDNGVIQYKNNKFKLYTTKDGLSDNGVNKIYSSSKAIWIATTKGVTQFQNGSWTAFTAKDGLCSEDVRDITSDDKGNIYFATNKGIAIFNGSAWKKYDESNGLSTNEIKAIAYDTRRGILWVACGESDVDNYNGKEWNSFMGIQEGITSIMVDTQSRIWFGSDMGIIKYNGFEWVTDPSKIGFPAASVSYMYRDHKGDLFFGLESGVLHMKNPYPF